MHSSGQSAPGGHDRPISHPESSQRTMMNDPPHPHIYTNPPSSLRPAIVTGQSDLSFFPAHHPAPRRRTASTEDLNHNRGDPYPRHIQRTQSSFPSSAQRYSPNSAVSPGTQVMNPMMNRLSFAPLPSPTYSASSSSSASPITPYVDRSSLRPGMSTLQIQSHTLEPVEDPENRSTYYSFIDSGGSWKSNNDKNPQTVLDNSLLPPSIYDRQGGRQPPSSGRYPSGGIDHLGPVPNSESSTGSLSPYSSESDASPIDSSIYHGIEPPRHPSASASTSDDSARGSSRKNKMHQCQICLKWFPRPSGLDTHMNSHTGAKRECPVSCREHSADILLAFKCPVETCNKAFAVRSNAKRHLRIHGINTSSVRENRTTNSPYTVGFDTPVIADNDPSGSIPKLKWVDHDLTTRESMDRFHSPSVSPSSADEGGRPPSPMGSAYSSEQPFEGYDRVRQFLNSMAPTHANDNALQRC